MHDAHAPIGRFDPEQCGCSQHFERQVVARTGEENVLSLILPRPWPACSSRSGRTSGFELFGLRVRIERHAPVPDHLRALEQ
jgi:hypothetical protein